MMILVMIIANNPIPEKNTIKAPIILANTLKIVVITSSIVEPILVAPDFAVFAIFSWSILLNLEVISSKPSFTFFSMFEMVIGSPFISNF